MLAASPAYCDRRTLAIPFDVALTRTREALAAEGFGVLSEIDISATLRKKLDVDFRPYTILGACNPPLAYRALTIESDIGVFLPCNVVVYQGDTPQQSIVAAVDPEVSLGGVGNTDLAPVAGEVKQKLQRVLAAIAESE